MTQPNCLIQQNGPMKKSINRFYLVQKRDGNPTFPYTTITTGDHQTQGNSDTHV